MKLFKDKIKLTTMCVVLSVFTVLAYHFPFFSLVLKNTEGGLNGTLIFAGLAVLMLALDFFFYYLILYVGRFVGKCILAFTFIADAITLYFINSYEVLITDKMMGNVFHTVFGSIRLLLTVCSNVRSFPGYSSLRIYLCPESRIRFPQEVHGKHRSRLGHSPRNCARTHEELALDRQKLHRTRQPSHALVIYCKYIPLLQRREET